MSQHMWMHSSVIHYNIYIYLTIWLLNVLWRIGDLPTRRDMYPWDPCQSLLNHHRRWRACIQLSSINKLISIIISTLITPWVIYWIWKWQQRKVLASSPSVINMQVSVSPVQVLGREWPTTHGVVARQPVFNFRPYHSAIANVASMKMATSCVIFHGLSSA